MKRDKEVEILKVENERHIVGVIDEKHRVYWCRTGRPRPALPRKTQPISSYWQEQYKSTMGRW